jgi:hypothetical protein
MRRDSSGHRGLLPGARLVVGGVAAVVVAMGSGNPPASAQTTCADYGTLNAEGIASGLSAVQSLANATIVNVVDVSGPAAQATVDSIVGSSGRAGSPFSSTVSENAGFFGLPPGSVPVFAESTHPRSPEASQSSPAFTLHATSTQFASTASAEVGIPASPAGAAASARATASAECADDGTVRAIADSTTDSIAIAGVLTIGSVRSHAEVSVGPDGSMTTSATIAFEGIAVLGQPVSITEQGVVVGPSTLPLPENPLTTALSSAGITVRLLEAVEDEETGTAIAPGVEISVPTALPVGTEPAVTTLTIGRAFAHADFRGVTPRPTPPTTSPEAPVSAPSAPAPIATSPPPFVASSATPVGPAAPTPAVAQPSSSLGVRLADWSIAPAYYALALGTLLSLGLRAGLRRLVVRFRWT